MGIFSRKSKEAAEEATMPNTINLKPGDTMPIGSNQQVVTTKPSGYIEIVETKKGSHLRIKGGNHKIRFVAENYYSDRNATRAANLFSAETGLPIIDRRKK